MADSSVELCRAEVSGSVCLAPRTSLEVSTITPTPRLPAAASNCGSITPDTQLMLAKGGTKLCAKKKKMSIIQCCGTDSSHVHMHTTAAGYK